MRLLELASFYARDGTPKLVEFLGANIPEYAILSHTWTDDEVLFADIQAGTAQNKRAYQKILFAIEQTRRDGWHYLWVDTCCIDKSSSAELQEAINSMFTWYQRAERCYAYLQDVASRNIRVSFAESLKSSRWFTRGWTLQELLAPREVYFYSEHWFELGIVDNQASVDDSFLQMISQLTGIAEKYLADPALLRCASVATRMSWASRRECTREEDIAYSLLGIFDVNMPLLYGEGSRAFLRLQEEILRRSDDTSIFMWKHRTPDNHASFQGLLAPSPACFLEMGKVQTASITLRAAAQPYTMTNKGLQVRLPLEKVSHGVYLAILDCDESKAGLESSLPGVLLRRLVSQSNQFARICCDTIIRTSSFQRATEETFFVRQDPEASGWTDVLLHARRSRGSNLRSIWGTSHYVRIQLSQSTRERFSTLEYVTYTYQDSDPLSVETPCVDSNTILRTFHLSRRQLGPETSSGIMLHDSQTGFKLVILLGSPSPPFIRFGAYSPSLAPGPDLDLHMQSFGTEYLLADKRHGYHVSITAKSPAPTGNSITTPGHVLHCQCPIATSCCDRDQCHELVLDIECQQLASDMEPAVPLVKMGAALLERYALPMLPNFVPLALSCPVHTTTQLARVQSF